MFKKMFGKFLSNLGYISILDYNAAIYDNVSLQREIKELSKLVKNLLKWSEREIASLVKIGQFVYHRDLNFNILIKESSLCKTTIYKNNQKISNQFF